MKSYTSYNYVAFVEVPLQAFSLKSILNSRDVFKVFILKRKNWNLIATKFEDILETYKSTQCNLLLGLIYFFLYRYKCNAVILPSHQGKSNRLLIVIASKIYKKVIVLDDGNYSVQQPIWLEKQLTKRKNLNWYSSFNNNYNIENIYHFSFYNPLPNYRYENTIFLILPDFEGLGLREAALMISEEDERKIIKKIQDENKNAKIIVFPHRRGRINLYEYMELCLKNDVGCFEHWYSDNEFKNCKIYSIPSSATWILCDQRVEVNIICKELFNLNKKEKTHYEKFILNSNKLSM